MQCDLIKLKEIGMLALLIPSMSRTRCDPCHSCNARHSVRWSKLRCWLNPDRVKKAGPNLAHVSIRRCASTVLDVKIATLCNHSLGKFPTLNSRKFGEKSIDMRLIFSDFLLLAVQCTVQCLDLIDCPLKIPAFGLQVAS